MHTVSDTFNTAIKEPSRDFLLTYMDVNNVRTTVEDIQNFTIEYSIGSSDKLTIGNANSAKISASMIITANTPSVFAGEVRPVAAMTYDNTTTDIPLGVFYIDKTTVKITDLQVTFDAYDIMYSLDDSIYDGQECSNTRDIITELGKAGIPVYASNSYASHPWSSTLDGKSVREIIKEIALLDGSNAMFDRYGKLVFVHPKEAAFSINDENYISYVKDDNALSKISKLTTTVKTTTTHTVTDEEGESHEEEIEVETVYSVGDNSGTTLEVSSLNIKNQDDLNAVYQRAGLPLSYQAYVLESQGFVHLDCGDIITLATNKGEIVRLPIASHALKFSGGFHSTFKAASLRDLETKAKVGLRSTLDSLKQDVSGIKTDITTATGDAANALIAAGEANSTANNSLSAAIEAQQKAEDLTQRADNGDFKGEDATVLMIDSSRGTVFKNDKMSTKLSVTIYNGANVITDYACLKKVFGPSAMLQWKWQRADENTFGTISASDSRFLDNGFGFMLSPEDVDEKITFMCELIID